MNKLKELRIQRGLTLDDIEAETGIKRATFSRYENEKSEPKLATWQKLADYFDVSIGYLQGVSEYASKERQPIWDDVTKKESKEEIRDHLKRAMAYQDERTSEYLSERFKILIGDDDFTNKIDENLSNLSDRLLISHLLNGVANGVMSILSTDIGLKNHRTDLKQVSEQLDQINNNLRKLSDNDKQNNKDSNS